MLEKVISLDNIGVFQKGVPKAHILQKATLIYAENARGKSTLAAVLQACSSGDVSAMVARSTIGAAVASKIQLRFLSGATGKNVTFDGVTWDTTEPRVTVFDQGFVERNVYAGSEVNSEHHQALLDFALGTAAVAKKAEVDKFGTEQVNATKRRTSAEDKLKGYMGKTHISIFLKLANDPDIDKTIASLTKRIADAKEATNIAARSGVKELTVPIPDFAEFAAIATHTLANVHDGAEKIVGQHVAKVGGQRTEQWLSDGHALIGDDNCPFCGQATSGVELIAAYKTHFNDEYAKHSARVASLATMAKSSLSDTVLAALSATCDANADRVAAWATQLALTLPVVDTATLKGHADNVTKVMLQIGQAKEKAPLAAVDTSELVQASASFAKFKDILTEYNAAVGVSNSAIAIFKKALAAEKEDVLTQELRTAELRKVRHSAEVVKIVDERQQADTDRDAAEIAKTTARKELDALMAAVLQKFQVSINKWLAKFGAPFTIDKLKANYLGGGTPRTEYGIVLRGSTFAAGKKAANAPSFHTALSEGDKRTLAFAFFLAHLLDDKGVDQNIVVLDDVFTSLDKHRRAQTVDAITEIAKTCSQVVVMGHDGYFLRQLSRRLEEKNVCAQLTLQLRRAANNFSELDPVDLDELCASEYYKRYRALSAFIDGEPTPDLLNVAQGLRPLVEGHLHRRFPGRIKEGVTFGVILGQIKDAKPDNPLSVMIPYLQGLHEFNDFAGAFHHDTTGKIPRQEVTDAELKLYGDRAMRLIHTGVI